MKRQGFKRIVALLVLQCLVFTSAAHALVAPPPAPTGGPTVTAPPPVPSPAGTPAPGATPGTGGTAAAPEVCTTFQERLKTFDTKRGTNGEQGILTEIYGYIKGIVGTASEKLFKAFINNNAYQSAVGGALVLMIIIFGIGFMIGVIQPSFGQVLIRLIKMGLVLSIISPTGWAFFNTYMVAFFNDGTDELITGVVRIGLGGGQLPAGAGPFYQLDALAEFLIQPDTIIAIMGATFAGGPFSLAVSGLLLFAMAGFLSLIIGALRTYAVSYVARSLLLGLAPIFFVFLLFEKTKQLFMSWVNALVSLSLQPILLFTFLSFFLVLIESATKDMLNTDLCWSEFKAGEGTTNAQSFWRFKDPKTGDVLRSEMTWKGSFECNIAGRDNCPEFPLNIIDVLTFLILIYLAQRFSKIIDRIANELSNTYISLDAGSRLDQFLKERTGGAVGGGGAAGGGGSGGGGGGARARAQAQAPAPTPPPANPAPQQSTRPTGAGG